MGIRLEVSQKDQEKEKQEIHDSAKKTTETMRKCGSNCCGKSICDCHGENK